MQLSINHANLKQLEKTCQHGNNKIISPWVPLARRAPLKFEPMGLLVPRIVLSECVLYTSNSYQCLFLFPFGLTYIPIN
ncbi:hypothetical protein HanRHA438_Chr11g0496511 [Helianthus annuus]|nr:hypothetical protein HanRHA438_Chr11g0496511 [Helianthus annuus]